MVPEGSFIQLARSVSGLRFDTDQKESKYFFGQGQLFFPAIDPNLWVFDFIMAENVTRIPVKTQEKAANVPSRTQGWTPFLSLRREMDRLFDDFGRGFWQLPIYINAAPKLPLHSF